MRRIIGWLPALVVLAFAVPAPAADLTKIDRTIRKEPKYANQPYYALLVFGPDAATKVWLVLDGDVLYVDRNGNGDFTEPGERLTVAKSGPYANPGMYSHFNAFELGSAGADLTGLVWDVPD